jgi:tRNA pseudouridine38-40 synthase
MLLTYDGTRYNGWQIQPNGVSIQGMIEQKLFRLLKKPIRLIGAGRTDTGVHALGQVAHFTNDQTIDCEAVLKALNGCLPPDIRIREFSEAHEDFHAQHSALSKEYHYHLWLEKMADPFVRLYRHHFKSSRFSKTLLQQAATYFIGTHDFASFSNVGGSVKSTIRTIYRLDILEQNGGLRLEFEGNGFLYKMIRTLVGTLLEIATEKRALSDVPLIFAARDRRAAGSAAPAQGLFLVKIDYPEKVLNISTKEPKCEKGLQDLFSNSLTSPASK